MNILCCQVHAQGVLTREDMVRHQQRIRELLLETRDRSDFDLVLLPELSAVEYSTRAFDNLTTLATPLDGWLTADMAELAQEIGAAICFGMPRSEAHRHYISQLVVDADGSLRGYYDKVHIAQFGGSAEKPYFTRGNHICVFETAGFRFGVVICYDMRFGDYLSMIVRDHNIDAMLHPVAFSHDGSFASWRSFVGTRALENQIYWLSLNRAGKGWGHSVFCPPWFEQHAEVTELGESEVLQVIALDRARLRYADRTYPLKQDRLADYSHMAVREQLPEQ